MLIDRVIPSVVLFFSENQTRFTFAAAFPGGYFFAFTDLTARFFGVRWLRLLPLSIKSSGSLRQLSASLLRHHVRGVPVGPVFVALAAGTLFVLPVGGLR